MAPTPDRPGPDTPWVDRCSDSARSWADEAVRRVIADDTRSADTHLHVFPLPPEWGIDLYLKDESVHPTGSLKHRLARSLFLYGLANGWIARAPRSLRPVRVRPQCRRPTSLS